MTGYHPRLSSVAETGGGGLQKTLTIKSFNAVSLATMDVVDFWKYSHRATLDALVFRPFRTDESSLLQYLEHAGSKQKISAPEVTGRLSHLLAARMSFPNEDYAEACFRAQRFVLFCSYF